MEPPQPCLEDEEFQAPKSVWAELKAKLVPAEVPEVVSILGQAQIDRNDELHAEMVVPTTHLRVPQQTPQHDSTTANCKGHGQQPQGSLRPHDTAKAKLCAASLCGAEERRRL